MKQLRAKNSEYRFYVQKLEETRIASGEPVKEPTSDIIRASGTLRDDAEKFGLQHGDMVQLGFDSTLKGEETDNIRIIKRMG